MAEELADSGSEGGIDMDAAMNEISSDLFGVEESEETSEEPQEAVSEEVSEETPEETEQETPEETEEPAGSLLATPARRDDKHVSEYEKGRYERKDDWNDGRKGGARRRSISNTAMPEMVKYSSPRSRTPHGGIEMGTLYKENAPTYSREEQTLFENTTKVRSLVEQLEAKEANNDEA